MASSLIDKVIKDTYRIERVIGTGGMGSVFEASHLRIPKRFAIKLLSRKLARNKEALQRFYREAKITSELGHEKIVEVLDFNRTESGQPYIVMELLEGEDLAHRLYRLDRMDLDQTTRILQQVASAMTVAHERGIVHRDLKPQNIFLCAREGKDDLVKVLDFGITRVLGSDSVVTKRTTVMGSLYYIAPEQARSSDVGPSADIYSMGCIVYTMLAGVPPFFAEEKEDIVEQILTAEPAPLGTLNEAVPELVDRVVQVALRKDPRRRYRSMAEFAQELERAKIRSRSKDFERTDLMSAQELLGAPAPRPDGEDKLRMLMDLETDRLSEHPGDPMDLTEVDPVEELDTPAPGAKDEVVDLTDMDMEEADTPAPEPLGPYDKIVDLTDADMEEADTPAPEPGARGGQFQHTEMDAATSMDWPPGDAEDDDEEPPTGETDIKWPPSAVADLEKNPTDEYQSVSASLKMERRETDKVRRVTLEKLADEDSDGVQVGADERRRRATDKARPGPDVTGPFNILEDKDTDQVVMLRRSNEKIPTDELAPTKVVWQEDIEGAGDDSALFHDAHISEVSASPLRGKPARVLLIVLGAGAALALLVWLAIFAAGEERVEVTAAGGAGMAGTTVKGGATTASSTGEPVEVTVLGVDSAVPWPKIEGVEQNNQAGVLVVTTTAGGETIWAEVYINGNKAGSTPLRKRLPTGGHRLQVRKAGFHTITRRIEIGVGKTSRIHLQLQEPKNNE